MKLSDETLSFIQNVVHTAGIVDIDSIIIDPESVRGLADNHTVVLLEKEVPELEIGSIGLNRTDVFLQRLDVVKDLDGFAVEAVMDGSDKGFVRSLTLKAKGTKVDYRCANPTTIRAPRVINDEPSARVDVTAEAVKLLQKGAAAMGSDLVEFHSDGDGVHFSLVDVNNDTFEHQFAEKATPLTEGSEGKFTYKYPVKTLLALFKDSSVDHFSVGGKGTMLVKVSGLGVYVLPKV